MAVTVMYPLNDIPGDRLCIRRQDVADALVDYLYNEEPDINVSLNEEIQRFFDKYHAVFFEPDKEDTNDKT